MYIGLTGAQSYHSWPPRAVLRLHQRCGERVLDAFCQILWLCSGSPTVGMASTSTVSRCKNCSLTHENPCMRLECLYYCNGHVCVRAASRCAHSIPPQDQPKQAPSESDILYLACDLTSLISYTLPISIILFAHMYHHTANRASPYSGIPGSRHGATESRRETSF